MDSKKIITIIAGSLGVKESELSPNTSMEDTEEWDSLTHMEMIADLESEYGFEFTADEIMQMTTIGAVIKAVEEKMNGNKW